ncbi:MAG: hypothetical protein JWM50_1187 [Microbacteriaceae bacterium]|nr:hypothetical protein [Microbacteriaceae bacterium]
MIYFMPRPPRPGGVTIEPRTFTDNPKKFGATSSRLAAGPVETPQQGAAELQHAVSNVVREHLLDLGLDLKSFCAETELPAGVTFERFYRISNGTQMMGLTDLMFWADRIPDFGAAVHAAIDRTVDEGRDTAK